MAGGSFFRGYIYLIKWINYMFIEQLSVYNYQFSKADLMSSTCYTVAFFPPTKTTMHYLAYIVLIKNMMGSIKCRFA